MKIVITGVLLMISTTSLAILKTWVGNAGDAWINNASWSPSGAPGTTDDVVFNTTASVLFTTSIPAIKSLKITNNATVLIQANNSLVIGYTFGFPLTIDNGATLQLIAINSSAYGVTMILDGTSVINGTLDMLGGGNTRVQLYQGIASTAKITVTGKVRTGYSNIGGVNADAGSLESSGASTSKLIFASGSEYEIARQNASTIGVAEWAPDATLKITGGQVASNFAIYCSGTNPSQLGRVIWDCPNQGGAATFYLGTYPKIDTIKGDFIVNSTNGKALRFTTQNNTAYTTTFNGNFEVNSPATTIEMFSTAAPVGSPAEGHWVFMKNVNILGQISAGNHTSANRSLDFAGSTTGEGGTGPQSFAVGGITQAATFDIVVKQNQGNGILLNTDVSQINNLKFLYNTIDNMPSNIILGNHNLTVGVNNGTIVGGGGNGWIVTNGSGFLKIPLSAGVGKEFTIGASQISYDPVGVFSNTADTFAIQVKGSFSHPVAHTDYVYDREWNVVSNSTDAQLEFLPDPMASEPTVTGDYVIGHYTDGGWTELPVVCCGQVFFSNFSANFTSFSPFAVGISTGFGTSSSGTIYTFIGVGNWSNPNNWSNATKPPPTLSAGDKIIINPGDGICVLDEPYTVAPGASLTINSGKNLVVNGNLTIH
ncbi:MAG: hypothetical protein IPP72_17935 [Chitinophagaceae bacterium]|nr:hypothetical protein [Chitinophagaceae bacterium]